LRIINKFIYQFKRSVVNDKLLPQNIFNNSIVIKKKNRTFLFILTYPVLMNLIVTSKIGKHISCV